MLNWKIKNTIIGDSKVESEKLHPLIVKLLQNRGMKNREEMEAFFDFDYDKDLVDPAAVAGMGKAVGRIIKAREAGEKIAVFGDYDADGVTATAILSDTLEQLGFQKLTYYIPDRQTEGYGMNEEAINHISKEGVTLIITVDCGITNYEEINKAKKLGIDVIVTDHHHIPEKIPEAVSIINPKMKDSGFGKNDLAGVGVAFKLAQALYRKIDPERIDQLKWALDLVAIGTIADCVDLLFENRMLVKYGLVVLSKTKKVGLQEMFQVGRISISEDNVPGTRQVAYQIAPRINAAGRMDHASVSYNLIVEKDRAKARYLALELENKNQERQKATAEIVREVEALANNSFRDRNFIFAENEHWPAGILGLIAGKISDEFQKPTAIFQRQGGTFVGSLRSVEEIDIMEVLSGCSDLLTKFGGHSQAAGVTIEKDKMEKFYERMSLAIDKKISGKKIEPSIDIDFEIKSEDIDWEFMTELKKMEPFGNGNPEPVFLMKDMKISDLKVCGNGTKHLKMSLRSSNGNPKIFDSIGFGMGEKLSDFETGQSIDVVFNLSEDEWNGSKKMQLKLIDFKLNK